MSSPNKAHLKKWVEALRSGQYAQGKGTMRSGNSYCCLGVAMEVAFDNGCPMPENPNWGITSTMPFSVLDWYGFPTSWGYTDPELRSPDGARREPASVLNDQGVPFQEIADRIVYTFDLEAED